MRYLAVLLFISIADYSWSAAKDEKTFLYDGSRDSVELILKTEKYHTEYRVEEVPATCTRKEVAGYRSVCTGSNYPGGYYPGPYHPAPHFPGRRHYPVPYTRTCYTEPYYRYVPYACTDTSRLPYQVKDFDVETRAIVDVTNLSQVANPNEKFEVSVVGDEPAFRVVGSKKFFVIKKKQDIRSTMVGSVKMIDALYVAELVEAAPILSALKMTNIAIVDSALKFKLGTVADTKNLSFKLTIVKERFLGSDKTILERELLASEVDVQNLGGESEASVDLNKLGVKLEDGKFSITAKVSPKFDGSLMNLSQFSDLDASRTLIYKVR